MTPSVQGPGTAPHTEVAPAADSGFVLVSVLWLLALLTVITLVLLTTVRLDVRAAGQLARHAEAEALADGLARLVALRLGDRFRRPLAPNTITADGNPYTCSHEEALVEITVTDVGGLVDLNMASVRLLEWLLRWSWSGSRQSSGDGRGHCGLPRRGRSPGPQRGRSRRLSRGRPPTWA